MSYRASPVAGESIAMRPREAARLLGVSERTLFNWTRGGVVPHFRVGRVVLYPRAELERWLTERCRPSREGEVRP